MGRKTPRVGDPAPDLEAITSEGKPFELKTKLKAHHNILLAFYRGHW